MTAALGHDMDRHAGVEQQRLAGAAQIMHAQAPEAQFSVRSWNSFMTALGHRRRVDEKFSPGGGGAGNISASSGSFTSERSTCAPSATPAFMRRYRSRSETRTSRRSRSIWMVRLPRAVLGVFRVRPC